MVVFRGLGLLAKQQQQYSVHCFCFVFAARSYAYTRHLDLLEKRRPHRPIVLLEVMKCVTTPLVWRAWEQQLWNHPVPGYQRYILTGLKEGFRVGFQFEAISCVSASTNMLSATKNPQVVDKYLDKEVKLGGVVGPMEVTDLPGIHVNRFGVIEKPHQPGKYRLIVDLSYPEGHSVNDGIEPELCTLKYTSINAAVAKVLAYGNWSSSTSNYRVNPTTGC